MTGKAGDLIIVESERALHPERRGVIEKVLQEQPPRFRVRREHGRTTILSPSGGVARIEPRTQEPVGA